MHAYLHCLSHTPLVGFVDPEQAVLDEVNRVIADARRRIAEFDPELVVLFAPDHYNGFFYDVMPPFCLGVGATAIGDFASATGDLPVPAELAEACAHAILWSFCWVAWTACRCCRCLLTPSPRRCRVFNAPGCWARRWAAFSIPSISGC